MITQTSLAEGTSHRGLPQIRRSDHVSSECVEPRAASCDVIAPSGDTPEAPRSWLRPADASQSCQTMATFCAETFARVSRRTLRNAGHGLGGSCRLVLRFSDGPSSLVCNI